MTNLMFDTADYSDVGFRRRNEDSFYSRQNDGIFTGAVCDGLGGLPNGEVASAAAVAVLSRVQSDAGCCAEALENIVFDANNEVLIRSGGGKTTLAMLRICVDCAVTANIGDSRVYQFRNGAVLFQSTDHSYAQEEVLLGNITPEQIREYPRRNVLTRCLGNPGPVKADIRYLTVQPGDAFLICSDGFWENIWEQDMLRCLASSGSAEEWLGLMRNIVVQNENDNHTAVAVIIS